MLGLREAEKSGRERRRSLAAGASEPPVPTGTQFGQATMTNYFNRFLPWVLMIAIVLGAFFLMFNASQQESAVMDELAHIPAGYGYVKYQDYRLNPEHPPLIKAIAAIPLLFQNLNFPINSSAWQKDINSQWAVGAEFLYGSGNNADQMIQWARLGPMLLTLLLIIFIYIWAKELIGRWWALLPTFLFALSPTILAHGHYVTTDVAAALGIFIASYYFIRFLLWPIRQNLIFAGLAFGIAQLMKFSAVLLIPFFGLMIIFFCIWKAKNYSLSFFKTLIRYIFYLLIIFLVGYVLVYLVYFIFTINYPIEKQKADTTFTLTSFASGPDQNWQTCQINSKVSLSRRMRCLADIDIWFSQNKILRPIGQYMLGVLMVFQRSSGGNTSYFLGEVSAVGHWYYFPAVFVLKEPIPSLVLMLLGLLLATWRIVKKLKIGNWKLKIFEDYLGTHFAEFSMLAFVIFYWLYSMNSPLNIGIRHILPTLPFIYILTASSLKKWVCDGKCPIIQISLKRFLDQLINFLKIFVKGALIAVLLIWYLAETLLVSPYFLSYFNEFAGGVNNGYRYVTDSNYDWGQDLKRLTNFVNQNGVDKIAVDYFGGGDPKYYLGNKAEYWQSSKGNPKDQGIDWLAVSINTLQAAFGKLAPGQPRNPEDEYQWLKNIRNPYEPDYKAGTSIFIYKL